MICTGFNEKMLYVCLSVVNYTVERNLMVNNVIFHSLSIFLARCLFHGFNASINFVQVIGCT